MGPWDSPVVAEPGALQAAALGPQGEGEFPGGAPISLDESYRLRLSFLTGSMEEQLSQPDGAVLRFIGVTHCQAGAGFIIMWRTGAAWGCGQLASEATGPEGLG